jgi:putative Holliday junction resolvase
MILGNLQDLAVVLAPNARLIGLDVGEKTIGIAISDERRIIASGRETIRRTKFAKDGARLAALALTEGAGGFVLGLPLNMNGSEGPRCQSVRQFAVNLEALTEVPITFFDERLSTVAVTRTMLEADLSRKKRADVVDTLAAVYILQGALDLLAAAATQA